MSEERLVYTTWPNAEAAAAAARTLVEERLAACANVLPGAMSVFWHDGEVQSEPEAVMFLKSTVKRMRALKERIVDLHPYDLPAIVALEIDEARSHLEYLDWIRAETQVH